MISLFKITKRHNPKKVKVELSFFISAFVWSCFIFVLRFVKISQGFQSNQADTISLLNFSNEQYSVKYIGTVRYLFIAHRLIVL